MRNIFSSKISSSAAACARAAAFCALALLFASAGRAQVRRPELKKQEGVQQQAARKASEDDGDDDEEVFQPPLTDPATILRKARFVLVRSDSVFVSGREVEDSLRKRKEFQAWGMVVTRDESQADLVVEITRKPLTRRFTFAVIDPRTREVVASGKTRSVIFGKKIANKVAEKFTNRVKVYRPYPPAAPNP